jgi:hypothetical protein
LLRIGVLIAPHFALPIVRKLDGTLSLNRIVSSRC